MSTIMEAVEKRGYRDGKAEGKVEGRVQGKVEGRAEGRIEGRAEGRTKQHTEDLAIVNLIKQNKTNQEILQVVQCEESQIKAFRTVLAS